MRLKILEIILPYFNQQESLYKINPGFKPGFQTEDKGPESLAFFNFLNTEKNKAFFAGPETSPCARGM